MTALCIDNCPNRGAKRRGTIALLGLLIAAVLAVPGCRRSSTDGGHEEVAGAAYRALADALNAEDWPAAERLARWAEEVCPEIPPCLAGLIAEAYWSAGRIEDAERVAGDIPESTDYGFVLSIVGRIQLARGQREQAKKTAERLASQDDLSLSEWLQIACTRLACDQLVEAADAYSSAAERVAKERDFQGWTDEQVVELTAHFAGEAAFYHAVAGAPLNQVTQYGQAPVYAANRSDVPKCDVLIDGHGPYRFKIDSAAGSRMHLAQHIAEQIGVRSLTEVLSSDVAQLARLTRVGLADQVVVGGINVRRVPLAMTPWNVDLEGDVVGVIGLAVFERARVTLDFENSLMSVVASADVDAPGQKLRIRFSEDGHLVVSGLVQGQPVCAMLDTGFGGARTISPEEEARSLVARPQVLLSPSLFDRLFADRTVETVLFGAIAFGDQRTQEMPCCRDVEFAVAGRTFRNVLVVQEPFLGTNGYWQGLPLDAIVGMSIFSEAKSLTIDYPRCCGWIEWREAPENSDK